MADTGETINSPHKNPQNELPNNPQPQFVNSPRNFGSSNPYFVILLTILRIVQVVIGIICFGLLVPVAVVKAYYFLIVVILALIISIMWVIINFLGITRFSSLRINLQLTELISTAVIACKYFIASIVQFFMLAEAYNYMDSVAGHIIDPFEIPGFVRNIAAGSFGIINFIVYSFGTLFLFLNHLKR